MQLNDHDDKVDFDICYFKGKLARAKANNDQEAITKITKQIQLLEDALIIYRIGGRIPPQD